MRCRLSLFVFSWRAHANNLKKSNAGLYWNSSTHIHAHITWDYVVSYHAYTLHILMRSHSRSPSHSHQCARTREINFFHDLGGAGSARNPARPRGVALSKDRLGRARARTKKKEDIGPRGGAGERRWGTNEHIERTQTHITCLRGRVDGRKPGREREREREQRNEREERVMGDAGIQCHPVGRMT